MLTRHQTIWNYIQYFHKSFRNWLIWYTCSNLTPSYCSFQRQNVPKLIIIININKLFFFSFQVVKEYDDIELVLVDDFLESGHEQVLFLPTNLNMHTECKGLTYSNNFFIIIFWCDSLSSTFICYSWWVVQIFSDRYGKGNGVHWLRRQ